MCKHLISAFYKTTNTPAPPLLCLVRNRRVGKGEARTAPGTIKSRGGHRLILSPSLSKVFCFFFVVIFLCWRRNTIEPREKKQATVKLVISTATITRESNIISTGRFREVWLKFYFFSLLLVSLFTIIICLPIVGI